jgi:hypothetical protein
VGKVVSKVIAEAKGRGRNVQAKRADFLRLSLLAALYIASQWR